MSTSIASPADDVGAIRKGSSASLTGSSDFMGSTEAEIGVPETHVMELSAIFSKRGNLDLSPGSAEIAA
jgi:hypothetical protein